MERQAELVAMLEKGEADLHAACQLFDSLETVDLESLLGTWRGKEFLTGPPLDGVLKKLNWYGKAFHDTENVDPLLFEVKKGKVIAVDPVPFMGKQKLTKAVGGEARMRMVEYRGKMSAAMIYDHLPILDHFRKVAEGKLLGMMDLKGDQQPFFFLLEKVQDEKLS